MTNTPAFSSAGTLRRAGAHLLVTVALLAHGSLAPAQIVAAPAAPSTASLSLPDAPGFSSDFEPSASAGSSKEEAEGGADPTAPPKHRYRRYATLSDMTIQPGQVSPALTPHRKVVLGLTQSFTLFSAVGWLASAGYTQLVDGSPNFGTDSGAFGQRLGVAALRNTSENIIGNAVLAPLFHEDARYYKLGRKSSVIHRVGYAVTRVLITRNDSGDARPNLSLLGGHLAGAALTNTYYPTQNQGFSETGKTFGTALGGAAVGFIVTEFIDDALDIAHLHRLE